MRCDAVRDRLADHATGRLGRWTAARVLRHLDRCEACARALDDEREIDARLAAWEDRDVPDRVWLRVREEVASPFVREDPPLGWAARLRAGALRFGLPYALGAATTALLVLAVTGGGPGDAPATGARGDATPESGAPVWRVDAAPALESGEEAVAGERPDDGVLIRIGPEGRHLLEELRGRGLLPRRRETPDADAVPVPASATRTH